MKYLPNNGICGGYLQMKQTISTFHHCLNSLLTLSSQRYNQGRRPGGITTQNQRPLPQNFYTNSDIFPQFNKPSDSSEAGVNSQSQVASEKQDLGGSGSGLEPKTTTSFRETAIIALKLSQSIMNLYKTVSPYLDNIPI